MNLLIFLDSPITRAKKFKLYSLQGKIVKTVLICTYNQGKIFLILPITLGGTCTPVLHWELPPLPPPLEVRPTIIIAGDSMVRSMKGWLLSRRKSAKVQTFPGATTDEMEVFIKPLINRYPQHPVLHCGTNDLAYKDLEDVGGNIIRMVQAIKKHGCSVSTLITHRDNLNQNEKVKKVNHLLNNSPGKNTVIIDHTNINEYHEALAHNLTPHIPKLEFLLNNSNPIF